MNHLRENVLDSVTVLIVLLALGLGGTALWEWSGTSGDESRDRSVTDWQEYTERGQRMGPEDALVTIVEWGDYQCPGCRVMAPRLAELRAAYPTQVAVIYRHWPLNSHSRSYPAARGSECAAMQGQFETMHELLNEESDWWRVADANEAFLEVARRAKVPDLPAFRDCMVSREPDSAIEQDIAAVNEIDARGTPALLINGVYPGSMPDSARLDALVREALGR